MCCCPAIICDPYTYLCLAPPGPEVCIRHHNTLVITVEGGREVHNMLNVRYD